MTRLVTYCIPWNSSTISKGLHALNLKELKRRICMVPRSERNGSSSILRSYWGWICRCHAWCWCFPRKRRTDNFWDNAYLISLELVVTLDESWYSEHQDWFCSWQELYAQFAALPAGMDLILAMRDQNFVFGIHTGVLHQDWAAGIELLLGAIRCVFFFILDSKYSWKMLETWCTKG